MSKRLLDEVEKILEGMKDVVVPVKKIWKMLQFSDEFNALPIPTLDKFIESLRNDDRFEFMPSVSYNDIYEGLNDEEREEREMQMESLGFFSGERIKLQRIKLTEELIADMIERSVNRMMNALKGAWETKPNDKMTEKRLLDIMKKTQQLQKDIQKVVKKMRKE